MDSYGYLEAFGVKSTKKKPTGLFSWMIFVNKWGPKTRIPKNHKMTCLGWILNILFENPGK